ncbi:MAG: hypothetical protein ACT4OS_01420 [Acidimicrobiales bacterium]
MRLTHLTRGRGVLLAVVLALLTVGCQAEIAADVRLDPGGSGMIAVSLGLDEGALAALGDPVTGLVLSDLRSGGWTVEAPVRDGSMTRIRARHRFADVAEANALLERLGPAFPGLRLERTATLLQSRSGLTGAIDLSGGIEALSDAELTSVLGDPAVALGLAGGLPESSLTAVLTADLGPAAAKVGAPPASSPLKWRAALGQRVEVQAQAMADRTALGLAAAGAAAAVAAALATIVLRRRSKVAVR